MFNPIFQIAPRFFGFVFFFAMTWFMARLTKSIFSRSLAGSLKTEKNVTTISKLAFWTVFGLMAPFLLSTAGINIVWLYTIQLSIAGMMKSWPVWFALSFCTACVFFVIRETPKAITNFRDLIPSNDL